MILYRQKIDLHGCDCDHALWQLESILYRERGIRLEIVHGCGHGILRQAVRNFLITCPCIERIEFGEIENHPGGSGVTIAYTFE